MVRCSVVLGANTYNYASCNPANRTDPSGLINWGDVGKFAGGLITCVGAGRVGAYVALQT
jgi:hypothetical protein